MSALTRRQWIACAALILVGCKAASGPEEPVWGKQACAHCKMLLSDKRYAAQLVDASSERSYFDDIGCLVSFVAERRVKEPRIWVRDEGADLWLVAEVARYHGGAKTPMDYGFAAGAAGDLSFEDVRKAVLARVGKGP